MPLEQRIGTTIGGKWTIERLLGCGAMAAVYLGRHEIGHCVALKLLHGHLASHPEIRERFAREARAVNRFRHPGAVEIRDIDETADGEPYLVMEYLEGESLADRFARTGPLACDLMLQVVDELLDVLATAHDQRIIHRDIKPENLFLLRSGRLKVLDFGIAKMRQDVQHSGFTREGAVLGTVAYMPPEQVCGKKELDQRVDLFAVGATMFHLISGRHVHPADGEPARMVKMATEPAPPLSTVAPTAPEHLCLVVDRALAFEPAQRYPDAAAMQGDIQALRADRAPPYALSRQKEPLGPTEDPEPSEDRPASESLAENEPPLPASYDWLDFEQAEQLVGQRLGGRYHLRRLLGRGGMGAVYEAEDDDGERYAIKVILAAPVRRRAARERFRREATVASSIDDPHVTQVLHAAVDEVAAAPYIVMELLAGHDLEWWLERNSPMQPATVASVFRQACLGVSAAHQRGVVHRDIKPGNIFLCADDSGIITVKICDFGLAKDRLATAGDSKQSLTQSGGVLGTPKYSSPEQATNAKRVDERADIWGLCLSMNEALSGTPPWPECETVGELIVAICTTDISPLRETAPWVEAEFAAVIDRGLRRDPTERWATMDELARALRPFASESPLTERVLQQPGPSKATPASTASPTSGASSPLSDLSLPTLDLEAIYVKRRSASLTAVLAAGAVALIGIASWLLWPRAVSDPASSLVGHPGQTVRRGATVDSSGANIDDAPLAASSPVASSSPTTARSSATGLATVTKSSPRSARPAAGRPAVSTTATASASSTAVSAKPTAQPSSPTPSATASSSKPAPPELELKRTW